MSAENSEFHLKDFINEETALADEIFQFAAKLEAELKKDYSGEGGRDAFINNIESLDKNAESTLSQIIKKQTAALERLNQNARK